MEYERLQQTLRLFGEVEAERVGLGMTNAENQRNTDNLDMFEAMIREAYDGVLMVVAGHHIMAMREGNPLPIEIPSADTLIFDHIIARAVWKDRCEEVLTRLALEPVTTRDARLREFYYGRQL